MYPLYMVTLNCTQATLNSTRLKMFDPSALLHKTRFKRVQSRPIAAMHLLALLIMKSSLSRCTQVSTIKIGLSSPNVQINCIISFLSVENV